MSRLLLVCLGGALGSGARYLISGWALRAFGPAFPYGTLAVNLIGSFFICLLMRLGVAGEVISPNVRIFLTTGVMGGLTTYSTFDYETFRFTQEAAYGLAALNVAITLVVCFVAGMLGDATAKLLVRA
jgi:CrcB protein